MAPRAAVQNTSLDAAAWIEAAFDALAEAGIDAVRVDPLARKLGVTRGSFYWHFADRAALHTAMLKEWRKRQSYRVGTRIESQTTAPDERLKRTLALPLNSLRAQNVRRRSRSQFESGRAATLETAKAIPASTVCGSIFMQGFLRRWASAQRSRASGRSCSTRRLWRKLSSATDGETDVATKAHHILQIRTS
ncbi:MAG: TetR/AcrR family transcriptional regulator [Hyphomonadaceae bacterium]